MGTNEQSGEVELRVYVDSLRTPGSIGLLHIFGMLEYARACPFQALWMVQTLVSAGFRIYFYSWESELELQRELPMIVVKGLGGVGMALKIEEEAKSILSMLEL